jgi:2-aminoadipate transaminase
MVEDDPYGELRFEGAHRRTIFSYLPDRTVYLGSFSKTIAPSFRIGWVVAPPALYDKLLVAKQAADLHTNYFSQRVIHRYLVDNDLDAHIARIASAYEAQKNAMVEAAGRHFPEGVRHTRPDGGMFLWAELPEGASSLELFDIAVRDKVVFVPGVPFYTYGGGKNTLRLNFSCADKQKIEEGMARLGRSIRELTAKKG